MTTKVDLYAVGKWLLFCGWVALSAAGMANYTGSWLIYAMFSLVFLAMLISGFYRQISYGYLFLVVMLWLGFWLKVTMHLIFEYPYVEPVGRFIGTPGMWDEVLIVASAIGAGVLLARLLLMLLVRNNSAVSETAVLVPGWYLVARRRIWLLLGASLVLVAGLNMVYSFFQTGIEPKAILVWPLNAVISLMLAAGYTMSVATLIWWDILLGKSITMGGYPILMEGFISTVSGLSRGLIVFHDIPQMVALYQNRNRVVGYTKIKAAAMVVVFVIATATSFVMVNSLREVYYAEFSLVNVTTTRDAASTWDAAAARDAAATRDAATDWAGKLGKFVVDRWIGIEGVMAVVSFPAKGFGLFERGLLESSATGQAGVLYKDICLSRYEETHTGKFRFGSLPGAGAFLYFTGTVWAVLLGMMAFTLLVVYSERGVSTLTHNPLLSAFVGGAIANIVVQFGVAPRQIIAYCIALAIGICLINVVQTTNRGKLVSKASANNV